MVPCHNNREELRRALATFNQSPLPDFGASGPRHTSSKWKRSLLAIVGPNASGKTAVLQALCKLFGVARAQRTVRRSDFHLPPGVPPDDRTTRTMSMDVIIALPELAKARRPPIPSRQPSGTCNWPVPARLLFAECALRRNGRTTARPKVKLRKISIGSTSSAKKSLTKTSAPSRRSIADRSKSTTPRPRATPKHKSAHPQGRLLPACCGLSNGRRKQKIRLICDEDAFNRVRRRSCDWRHQHRAVRPVEGAS